MDMILASASPRRRELMKLITENFTAVSTDADETVPEDISSEKASEYLSLVKAEAAAELYPDDLVIGCDTIVIVDDLILGKPDGESQCRQFLSMLSGRTHRVITGCTLFYKGMKRTFSCSTDVRFFDLSESDIEGYIATGEPFDKAGGYGIQGKGSLLVESISGDYFNVVGLPVSMLNRELEQFINSVKE